MQVCFSASCKYDLGWGIRIPRSRNPAESARIRSPTEFVQVRNPLLQGANAHTNCNTIQMFPLRGCSAAPESDPRPNPSESEFPTQKYDDDEPLFQFPSIPTRVPTAWQARRANSTTHLKFAAKVLFARTQSSLRLLFSSRQSSWSTAW